MNSRAAQNHTTIASMAPALRVCGSMPSLAHAQASPRAYQIISAGSNGLARGNAALRVDQARRRGHRAARDRRTASIGSAAHLRWTRDRTERSAGCRPWQVVPFVFDRDQIDRPVGPDTGRVQVRLEATTSGNLNNLDFMPHCRTPLTTRQIVDTVSGRTLASFKPKEIVVVGTPPPLPTVGGNDSVWIDLGTATVGFVPGKHFA